jgi:hypothetical protein
MWKLRTRRLLSPETLPVRDRLSLVNALRTESRPDVANSRYTARIPFNRAPHLLASGSRIPQDIRDEDPCLSNRRDFVLHRPFHRCARAELIPLDPHRGYLRFRPDHAPYSHEFQRT